MIDVWFDSDVQSHKGLLKMDGRQSLLMLRTSFKLTLNERTTAFHQDHITN